MRSAQQSMQFPTIFVLKAHKPGGLYHGELRRVSFGNPVSWLATSMT